MDGGSRALRKLLRPHSQKSRLHIFVTGVIGSCRDSCYMDSNSYQRYARVRNDISFSFTHLMNFGRSLEENEVWPNCLDVYEVEAYFEDGGIKASSLQKFSLSSRTDS